MRKLTDREIDLLERLVAHYDKSGNAMYGYWATPSDVGGRTNSYHSKALRKLTVDGFVESSVNHGHTVDAPSKAPIKGAKKKRGGRGLAKVYRISHSGRAALHLVHSRNRSIAA